MFSETAAAERGGGGFMTIRVRGRFDVDRGDGNHGWAGCDHYNSARPNLGSGCTAGSGGLSTGGNRHSGGNQHRGLSLLFSNNEVGSIELNTSPGIARYAQLRFATLPRVYQFWGGHRARAILYVPYAVHRRSMPGRSTPARCLDGLGWQAFLGA